MELLDLAVQISRYLNDSEELTENNTIGDLLATLMVEGMEEL